MQPRRRGSHDGWTGGHWPPVRYSWGKWPSVHQFDAAGADLVAIIGAVVAAPDVREATRRLAGRFGIWPQMDTDETRIETGGEA